MGFQPLKNDKNVFRCDHTIISTYVDDFMIISPSKHEIHKTITTLAKVFQLKDLGNMTKFIGINIEKQTDGIRINQEDKIDSLYQDMGMSHCKGTNTPISDDNMIDCEVENSCSIDNAKLYRSAVGSLLHIAYMTRPDIQYAVNRRIVIPQITPSNH